MKTKLYKSLLGSVIGASMLSLGSCTDLSETIYSELAAENMNLQMRMQLLCLLLYILPCVMCTGDGTVMQI